MTEIDMCMIKGVGGTCSCPTLEDLICVLQILHKRRPNAKVGINTFDSQLCIFVESDDEYGDTITIPEIN